MPVILAVDDDIHTLELISIYLSQSGYRVIKAVNGTEGLHILERQLPDLAIIDVMMPVMEGVGTSPKSLSSGCSRVRCSSARHSSKR